MQRLMNGLGRYFFPGLFFLFLMSCLKKVPIPNDTLIIGVESEVRNLDLRSTSDANSAHVISLFSQSLLRADKNLLPVTDLARTFYSKDHRTFTFELPADATFHDGTTLDCEDVLASFQQAAAPSSRIKSSFQTVKEFRCIDPLHFEIELTAPLARFLMADVSMVRIQPKEIALSSAAAPPIGSGPYRFVRRTYRDLHFERFDGLKRHLNGQVEFPYHYKHVIVRTLADTSIRWLSINSGDIDALMNALSPLRATEAMKSDRVQVFQSEGSTLQYLAVNLRNKKFVDIRVRQALMHAVDRDAIIRHKLFNMATKATSVFSPANFFHEAKLPVTAFDPHRARQLLSEANQLGMEIEIKTSTDPDAVSTVLVIVQQLREAGFNAQIRSYEFGTFFSDITKGNYEIYSLRWTAVTDPDFLQRIFHSREFPPGRNRVFYSNPKVDALLEAGGREVEIKKRQKLYSDAQFLIAAELPYIPLWYPYNVAVLGASIKGFEAHPTGTWESLLRSWKSE